jgi:hypothetical protein
MGGAVGSRRGCLAEQQSRLHALEQPQEVLAALARHLLHRREQVHFALGRAAAVGVAYDEPRWV